VALPLRYILSRQVSCVWCVSLGALMAIGCAFPHEALVQTVLGLRGADRCMSIKTYGKLKGSLLSQLRSRSDPPPRIMKTGVQPHSEWHANLRHLLHSTGGTVVRGFKLFKIQRESKHWQSVMWKATAHAVVATASASGSIVYADPNACGGSGNDEGKYVFVPSTRAHQELTDAQFISGNWLTGSVVGGHCEFCNALVAYEKMCGRARSVVAISPELLVSKPRVVVRMPPHFVEWHHLRGLASNLEQQAEQAELMGAAAFVCETALGTVAEGDGYEVGRADAMRSYSAITESTEAWVDGVGGLKLELECREKLLRGALSVEEARRLFFSHFDDALRELREVQTRRIAAWQAEWESVQVAATCSRVSIG
jgi:hypothetical protein